MYICLINHVNMKKIIFIALMFNLVTVFSQPPSYIPLNGLQAWYPFNGNANDDSGSGHNGISNGATLTTDRFGASNSAYMFGTNNYILIPDNVNFRPQVFTISSWVVFTGNPLSNYSIILAKNIGTGTIESIDMNYSSSDNSWFCNISSSSALGAFITSPENIIQGTWYNVVYQYDDVNNIQKVYVNGILTSSNVVTTNISYDTKPWTIGMEYEYNTPSFFFNGKIDDIGMWDRLLSPQEISTIYQSNPSGISEIDKETQICFVYPNPTTKEIYINMDNQFIELLEKDLVVNVFSYEGRLVKKQILVKSELQNSNKISIENLSAGFYTIRVESGKYIQNMKFIKN